ncbi:uncharacterized protein MKZ38_001751 [Zalerion maritima]|uniref:Uncharacterized protein n=1 Tax=Zalerion maritima TaxID=339359 RepID=A0AAD5RZG6_9PEZI|nr:uncharacterized protein MKZ38_001751 [Zalerion maritima]
MIELGYKTWRYLGLSVALGYAGLGGFAVATPKSAAKYFFGWDPKTLPLPEADVGEDARKSADPPSEEVIKAILPLVGARDLSIFAALMIFFHARQHSEMGVVILSGMVLCAADVVAIWKWKGPLLAGQILAGALSWGIIGYNLYFEDF